jgi:DNA-binding NarL/FixJ family response regulator
MIVTTVKEGPQDPARRVAVRDAPSKEPNISASLRAAISVYLVVQNRLLRETLVRLFQKRAGIDVAGEAPQVQSLIGATATARCDVLLMDSLAGVCAMELVDDLRDGSTQKKIVLFGMDEDEESFLKAVRLGVSGYLLKDASSAEIIAAVHGVAEGKAVCPPKLCMTLFRYVTQDFRQRSGMDEATAALKIGLTYRQRELIGLVAEGLTNKEIAAKLNLSEFTVKNHIHRIMRHVEADSRQEAVDVVRARGFLPQA